MATLTWSEDGTAVSGCRVYRVERLSSKPHPKNWRAFCNDDHLGDFPSYHVAEVACEIAEAQHQARGRRQAIAKAPGDGGC
jgi:hypothetical protein